MDNIFLQTSALLAVTVSIAFIVRFLRQPLLVAYIIAGIVAGPLFFDFLHGDAELFHAFSEFGVVLLLFLVGLSLNFDHIKKIGKASATVGISQFVFTSVIGFFILQALNFSFISSLYIAIAITFSSTIIIVKLLSEKKDTQTVYGRHVTGLMIVQDLIAITVMIVITSLKNGNDVVTALSTLGIKFLALVGVVVLLAKYALPPILDKVAKNGEFLFIFTIAWCFGIASLLLWLGFSVEIGAIIAGLSLGSSPYQPEISSRIKPLRDFFIMVFFVILGSEMQIANMHTILVPGAILSAFVLIGNTFILYSVFRLLKFTRRNSFLSGLTASQVSEFGFIVLFTGIGAGQIGNSDLQLFTLVALITIFFSSYAVTYNEQLYRFLLPVFRLFGKDKHQQREEELEPYTVWVFGYHRIGWKVCETLLEKKIRFAVVDFDPNSISKLKHRGIPAFFGDAADVEFLNSLPLEKSKMVISTLPEVDDQVTLTKYIRSKTSKTLVITNLYQLMYLDDLYEAGANYVMMSHLLVGNWISDVLSDDPWTKHRFNKLKKEQKTQLKVRFSQGEMN